MKAKHRAKFLNANIIDSEDEGWIYGKRLQRKVTNLGHMVAVRGPMTVGIAAAEAALDGVEDPVEEAQTAAETIGK